MVSRSTLWRHKKRLNELYTRLASSTSSGFNETFLHSTFSDLSNNTTEETFLNQAQPPNDLENSSNTFTFNYHPNVSITENKSEDVSDMNDDQMWFDEPDEKIAEALKNAEFKPLFQYPIMDNALVFNGTNQIPTQKEIAAALIVMKTRHRLSIRFINDLCKLLKILKMSNIPASFASVKRLFMPKSFPSPTSLITYICPVCCESSPSSHHCINTSCSQHSSFRLSPLQYLQLPMLPQLRDILSHTQQLNFEQQQQCSSNIGIIDDIYDGEKYQDIIRKENGKNFLTLVMNVDGIEVSKSSSSSLWIFTLIINEIKRSDRFKLKNVIIGGIVSTTFKPNRDQMQKLLSPIVEELFILEKGETFDVKGSGTNSIMYLKTFLIASCCDKPAQSLVQGISEPIGAFGCGRCELQGITVPIKPNSKKKIRVFPLDPEDQQQPRLRTNETYDLHMKIYKNHRFVNTTQLRDRLAGQISPCVLRDLTYFDVGTSFLSDSLHNIYHGVMKRLLRLWFDKKYRKQPWSIYSKLKVVDRYLSSIKYPSTTLRIPRSLSKYRQYKANETRNILLFGFSAFGAALPLRYSRHFLLLVVAIHIAESRHILRTQVEDIRQLLNRFLKLFPTLYTPRHNSQSVHSLYHVAASVNDYGSLSNYSTFNFESILGITKHYGI